METRTKTLYGGLRALERELTKEDWRGARYTIVVDENTFQHCLPLLISQVEPLQEAEFIEVPVGEECKSLEVAAQVWQTLMEGGADRVAVLVNLGGGTVCDVGGYVAAGYKRGIRHINVPTTLLAMVDAAHGGKTAINFGGVKNSIGHFYPPAITVMEPEFLDTLAQEEMENGRMEAMKTAVVTDPLLYSTLLATDTLGRKEIAAVARIKNRIVKADPYDHSIRKILNFGHTFGHAIEVFSKLPHGMAVGIGMKAAMYLSAKKTGLPEETYLAYSQWLKSKTKIPQYSLKEIESIIPLMHQDKKNADGEVRCVLIREPGAAIIDVEITDNEVRDTLLRLAQ